MTGSAERIDPPKANDDAPAVPAGARWGLFLDVDGTLLETADTPQAVSVDTRLVSLIGDLHAVSGGAVALVSGRTVAEVDALFQPLRIPVAGIHGVERRSADGNWLRSPLPVRELDHLRGEIGELAHSIGNVLLEDKGCAFALHFRQAPELEPLVRLHLERVAAEASPDFELLEGDCVFEIKPAIANKGTAIEAFMLEPPFAGRTPIFIGNDTTDLEGFAAVRRLNGIAIATGSRVSAEWRLASPSAVRDWLTCLLNATPGARLSGARD